MSNTITTDTPDISANDLLMAKEMADLLHQHYPGHLWAVSCDGAGSGFADVRNLSLSGTWGFRVKLRELFSASDFRRRIVMAGGEILERYNLSRGKLRQEELAAIPLTFNGDFKAQL